LIFLQVLKLRLGTRFGAKLLLCLEGLKQSNLAEAKQSLAPRGVPQQELRDKKKLIIDNCK
jgi:hypothetical protein